MKKIKKVLLTIIIAFMIFGGGIAVYIYMNRPVIFSDYNLNLVSKEDGIYHGICENNIVVVEVDVTIKDNQIMDIDITEHNNGLGEKAEKITESVIALQSLDVDSISGATYSSATILKAIENALE